MSNQKQTVPNFVIVSVVLLGIYTALKAISRKTIEPEDIDADNPYISKHRSSVGTKDAYLNHRFMCYETKLKPVFDQILSFSGLVLLAPLYAVIAAVVYIDDPGPVIFTQKRVGKDSHFFMLHKYRSMKMSAPRDVPTHMLEHPESCITKAGRILRKTSLDELPQLWDVFRGRMSVVGPRPALWNQRDLVAYREQYGANCVLPGITGLAQIHGRDKLEIPEKAFYDGKYTKVLQSSCRKAFLQDVKCICSTITRVVKQEGIIEGGMGDFTGGGQ